MNKLHYFNPGHETAVLHVSPHYMPPANQQKMRCDLSYLPAWYAGKEDLVWTEDALPKEYVEFLNDHFGNLPQAIFKGNASTYSFPSNKTELDLWGISPQAIHIFKELEKQYGWQLILPIWKDIYFQLNNRHNSKACLEYIQPLLPEMQPDIIPVYYDNEKTLESTLNTSSRYLVKSPYSSSGRGLLWLEEGEISQSSRQILHGMLKKQSSVSLEKVLNKTLDFSMQFYTDGEGNISFSGMSIFQTDKKGGYIGTFVLSQEKIQKKLSEWIDIVVIEKAKLLLIDFLSKNYASVYRGNIGVDMMIYASENQYFLHPCVEINMRTTMGFLALQLQKRLYNDQTSGFFQIDYSNVSGKIYEKHLYYNAHSPLQNSNGKIESGYLSLCPVTKESRYLAYIKIN